MFRSGEQVMEHARGVVVSGFEIDKTLSLDHTYITLSQTVGHPVVSAVSTTETYWHEQNNIHRIGYNKRGVW